MSDKLRKDITDLLAAYEYQVNRLATFGGITTEFKPETRENQEFMEILNLRRKLARSLERLGKYQRVDNWNKDIIKEMRAEFKIAKALVKESGLPPTEPWQYA